MFTFRIAHASSYLIFSIYYCWDEWKDKLIDDINDNCFFCLRFSTNRFWNNMIKKKKQLDRCFNVKKKKKNEHEYTLPISMTHFHLIRVLFVDFSDRFINITKKLVSRLDAPDQNCCWVSMCLWDQT